MTEDTRKGTCNACGKVRKLERRNNYWWYCSECKDLTNDERSQVRAEARAARQSEGGKPRFAYPCIGGPLDGEHATTADMMRKIVVRHAYRGVGGSKHKVGDVLREGGMYGHLADEYVEYNSAHADRKRIGARPSMVYIHTSKLLPLISPRSR